MNLTKLNELIPRGIYRPKMEELNYNVYRVCSILTVIIIDCTLSGVSGSELRLAQPCPRFARHYSVGL